MLMLFKRLIWLTKISKILILLTFPKKVMKLGKALVKGMPTFTWVSIKIEMLKPSQWWQRWRVWLYIFANVLFANFVSFWCYWGICLREGIHVGYSFSFLLFQPILSMSSFSDTMSELIELRQELQQDWEINLEQLRMQMKCLEFSPASMHYLSDQESEVLLENIKNFL